MRSDNGMVGVAVLWLLVAVSAIGYAALHVAKWQKSRSDSEMAEVQSRLLIAGSSLLAREAQFKFIEKTDRFETGSVKMIRMADSNDSAVTLKCTATVGKFEKNMDIGWEKIPAGWRLAYWAEP